MSVRFRLNIFSSLRAAAAKARAEESKKAADGKTCAIRSLQIQSRLALVAQDSKSLFSTGFLNPSLLKRCETHFAFSILLYPCRVPVPAALTKEDKAKAAAVLDAADKKAAPAAGAQDAVAGDNKFLGATLAQLSCLV